jgi:hypothetical protein
MYYYCCKFVFLTIIRTPSKVSFRNVSQYAAVLVDVFIIYVRACNFFTRLAMIGWTVFDVIAHHRVRIVTTATVHVFKDIKSGSSDINCIGSLTHCCATGQRDTVAPSTVQPRTRFKCSVRKTCTTMYTCRLCGPYQLHWSRRVFFFFLIFSVSIFLAPCARRIRLMRSSIRSQTPVQRSLCMRS